MICKIVNRGSSNDDQCYMFPLNEILRKDIHKFYLRFGVLWKLMNHIHYITFTFFFPLKNKKVQHFMEIA